MSFDSRVLSQLTTSNIPANNGHALPAAGGSPAKLQHQGDENQLAGAEYKENGGALNGRCITSQAPSISIKVNAAMLAQIAQITDSYQPAIEEMPFLDEDVLQFIFNDVNHRIEKKTNDVFFRIPLHVNGQKSCIHAFVDKRNLTVDVNIQTSSAVDENYANSSKAFGFRFASGDIQQVTPLIKLNTKPDVQPDQFMNELKSYRYMDTRSAERGAASYVPAIHHAYSYPSEHHGQSESVMYLERGLCNLAEINRNNITSAVYGNLIKAVASFHDLNLAHGNLTLENIRVKENTDGTTRFVLTGLASSHDMRDDRDPSFAIPNYCSPEMLERIEADGQNPSQLGQSSDIWALGCCFYKLYTGNEPRWSPLVNAYVYLIGFANQINVAIANQPGLPVDDTVPEHFITGQPRKDIDGLKVHMKGLEDDIKALSADHLAYLEGTLESMPETGQLAAMDDELADLVDRMKDDLTRALYVIDDLKRTGVPLDEVGKAFESLRDALKTKLFATFAVLNNTPKPINNPIANLILQMLRPDLDVRGDIESIEESFTWYTRS